MLIVADTNVIVSMLLWGGSLEPFSRLINQRRVQLVFSPATIDELIRVMQYPKIREDVEKLTPFVTVDPEFPQMNINTLKPLVLEALIQSSSGDEFAKKELLRRLLEFRAKSLTFGANQLEPEKFMMRIGLPRTALNLQLINAFLPQLTLECKTFKIFIKSKDGKKAEVIAKESGDTGYLEILKWHED